MQLGQRGGVIVNIGSSSVAGGRPMQGAYSSSKAGIQSLTETVALEGKPFGLCAHVVLLGSFNHASHLGLLRCAPPHQH